MKYLLYVSAVLVSCYQNVANAAYFAGEKKATPLTQDEVVIRIKNAEGDIRSFNIEPHFQYRLAVLPSAVRVDEYRLLPHHGLVFSMESGSSWITDPGVEFTIGGGQVHPFTDEDVGFDISRTTRFDLAPVRITGMLNYEGTEVAIDEIVSFENSWLDVKLNSFPGTVYVSPRGSVTTWPALPLLSGYVLDSIEIEGQFLQPLSRSADFDGSELVDGRDFLIWQRESRS